MEEKEVGTFLYGAKLKYQSGWSFLPHAHDYFHLFLILDGTCVFTVEKNKCVMEAEECLMIPPNMTHGLLKVKEAPVSLYELRFQVVEEKLAAVLGEVVHICKPDLLATQLIGDLASFALTRTAEGKAYLSSCFETLLRNLALQLSGQGRESVKLNAHLIDTSGFTKLSEDVVRYLDNHYEENLTLDQLAHELGYNKSYICTTFKNDCGFTVNDYLNLLRIVRAVDYLTYTTHDAAGICSQFGFRNVRHFNRMFEKVYGEIPRNSRRSAWLVKKEKEPFQNETGQN